MRSSNRLKGRDRGKEPRCSLACNRMQSSRSHNSVFIVFEDPRGKDAAVFRPRIYTRVSHRIKLSRERRKGGRNQWELRLYLRLRGIEPAGCHRRWSAPFVFRKKNHRSATGLTQATCVHANYLTLPSRKTKVCISNTGSRITRTSGITVHIYVKYRTAGVKSDNREL